MTAIETVGAILQGYADRAVFRGFSRPPVSAKKPRRATFKVLWHRGRSFDIVVDATKHSLHIPLVLPQVPLRSPMYRAFKTFVASRSTTEMPEHRRIDRRKARVAIANTGGNVSVTLTVRDQDYEYGTRKLMHLIHEVFLTFLADYFDYQVEAFELDPDRP